MAAITSPGDPGARLRRAVIGGVLLVLLLLVAVEFFEPRPDYVPLREIGLVAQPDGWRVSWVHPAGVSYDAGLRRGDRIITAAGRPVAFGDDPASWLARPVDLTVERAASTVVVPLSVSPALGPLQRLTYCLSGALFVLIGVGTWYRAGGGRVQTSFLILCLLVGFGLVATPAGLRGHPWGLVALYFAGFTLTALLVFARSFPAIRPFRFGRHATWQVAPEWLWLPSAILALTYFISIVGWLDYELVQIPSRVWDLIALVGAVLAIGQGWWQARQRHDRQALTQLTIIGGGAVVGFAPLLVVLLPQLVTGRFLFDPALVMPLTAFLPLSVAYAMLRYRVMDVDLVVNRAVVWGGVAILGGGAITVVREVGESLFGDQGTVANLGLIVLGALMIVPIALWVIRHLDRVVYGSGHAPHPTLAAAARALATSLDEPYLINLAVETVLTTLQPERVALYEGGSDGIYRPLAWQQRHAPAGGGPSPKPLAMEHPALPALMAGATWQASGTLLRPSDRPLSSVGDHEVLFVPAVTSATDDSVSWVLGLMARPSGLPFSSADIALLEVLAQSLAAALINARRHGRLQAAYADLRQTQLQLVQAAKLAAIGELSSGIAHELNQPLSVIRGRLQLMMEQTDEPVRSRLARLVGQTDKMAKVIDQLRSFVRQSGDERRPVAWARVVASALDLLGEQLTSHGISVEATVPDDLPEIMADAGQLEQVLINLLVNARDVLADRPVRRIVIAARRLQEPPEAVELTVTDTGPGIPPEQLAVIFDAFFTTKPAGQGTGLGLSISRGIIERHSGRLEVESALGVGTTFRIVTPTAAATASLISGQSPAA